MTDPWKEISVPNAEDLIRAKRVDENVRWGFFWARSVDGRCLLTLRHSAQSAASGRLPKLSGIDVSVVDFGSDEKLLMFRLQDSSQKEIFYQLCLDIVSSASEAASEAEAVTRSVARTWRWHHLLRGGGDTRLSAEEQKGLIGELIVLRRYICPHFSASDALEAWRGPLDSPKDFEIGRICIESKARRSASTPSIYISSMHQLDETACDELFLFVGDLDRALLPETGRSLTDYVAGVRDDLLASDQAAAEKLDTLLLAAGFRWSDDYSDTRWIEGNSRIFHVHGEFPRILGDIVPSGVMELQYSISLSECAPFQIDDQVLLQALGVRGNVN